MTHLLRGKESIRRGMRREMLQYLEEGWWWSEPGYTCKRADKWLEVANTLKVESIWFFLEFIFQSRLTFSRRLEAVAIYGTLYFIFCLFRAAGTAYGSFQARGWIRTAVAGLYHSHGNAGSELHLQPVPQFMAMQDPQPTEQGQGLNLCPPGYQSDTFPLSHDRNFDGTL